MAKLNLQASPFINYNFSKYLLGIFLFLLLFLIYKANHYYLWFFLPASALATYFVYEKRIDILLEILIKQCAVFILFHENLNIVIFLSAFLIIFDCKVKNYFLPEPFLLLVLILGFIYKINIASWGLEEALIVTVLAGYVYYFKGIKLSIFLIFNLTYLAASYYFYGLNSFGFFIFIMSLRFFRFPLETFILAVLIGLGAPYFAVFMVLARMIISFKTFLSLKARAVPPTMVVGDFKKVAFLKCRRQNDVIKTANYHGLKSCRSMHSLDQGPYACKFSCLGLGDCLKVCPQKAITFYGEVVKIDSEKCTGCEECLKICPRHCLVLETELAEVFIHCQHRYSLKEVSSMCIKACLGCGKCRKACPFGAILKTEKEGALKVDIEKCLLNYNECFQVCQTVCPRQILSKDS